MSLDHTFTLVHLEDDSFLDEVQSPSRAAIRAYNHYEIVDKEIIHDEIINYFVDFLLWVPSQDRGTDGINKLYNKDSVEPLIGLLSGIKSLFLMVPECIKLRGYPFFVEDKDGGYYDYHRFYVDKERSLIKINHFIDMAKYLRQPHYIIFHTEIFSW
jgi:hypothetical protein